MDPNQQDGTTNFEAPTLHISTIKMMMKDKDIMLESDEIYLMMAKVCEMFVEEMTMRAWTKVIQNGHDDNDATMEVTHVFDALVDFVSGISMVDEKTNDSPNRDD